GEGPYVTIIPVGEFAPPTLLFFINRDHRPVDQVTNRVRHIALELPLLRAPLLPISFLSFNLLLQPFQLLFLFLDPLFTLLAYGFFKRIYSLVSRDGILDEIRRVHLFRGQRAQRFLLRFRSIESADAIAVEEFLKPLHSPAR